MEKEFIPYELALRLKNLGFDEPCFGIFRDNKKLVIGCDSDFAPNNTWCSESKFSNESNISAPIFSQAFRYLRNKYDLRASFPSKNYGHFEYIIETSNSLFKEFEFEDEEMFTYHEKAELACLDKLLEVVEKVEINK